MSTHNISVCQDWFPSKIHTRRKTNYDCIKRTSYLDKWPCRKIHPRLLCRRQSEWSIILTRHSTNTGHNGKYVLN